jgi:hypothetical protein
MMVFFFGGKTQVVCSVLLPGFGSGFKVSISIEKNGDWQEIDEFVKGEMARDAVLTDQMSRMRTYEIRKDAISLDQAFQIVEQNRHRLKITDWAISNTSLEEVFLEISKEKKDEANQKKNPILLHKEEQV